MTISRDYPHTGDYTPRRALLPMALAGLICSAPVLGSEGEEETALIE